MLTGAEPLAVGVAGVAAAFDLRTRRIPNALTYAALATALGIGLLHAAESGLAARLGGIAAGFVPCFALFACGALGGGDVKLSAALGGLLGAARILDVLLLTAVLGALLALAVLAWRRSLATHIPFALPLLVALLLVVGGGSDAWRLP